MSDKPEKTPKASEKEAPKVEKVAPKATEPAKAEAKSKTVKVKFLRSHPSYGYFAGDTAEISAEGYAQHSKDGEFFEKL